LLYPGKAGLSRAQAADEEEDIAGQCQFAYTEAEALSLLRGFLLSNSSWLASICFVYGLSSSLREVLPSRPVDMKRITFCVDQRYFIDTIGYDITDYGYRAGGRCFNPGDNVGTCRE